jgi:hypothetical protein
MMVAGVGCIASSLRGCLSIVAACLGNVEIWPVLAPEEELSALRLKVACHTTPEWCEHMHSLRQHDTSIMGRLVHG